MGGIAESIGGAVGGVVGGLTGATAAGEAATKGTKSAAAAQLASTEKNIDFQKWLWGEQKGLAQPYADMGASAIGAYMGELGFTGTERAGTTFDKPRPTPPAPSGRGKLGGMVDKIAQKEYEKELAAWEAERDAFVSTGGGADWRRAPGAGGFTIEDMYKEPGYQFGLTEGQRAYETSGAAKGMQLSGRQAKALTRYGTDYASTKYNEAFNRRQVNLDNLYRMIMSGQAAAAGQAATGGQMGAQVGSSIREGGQAQAQMYSDIGNIQASQAMSGFNTLMDVGNLAASFMGKK